MPDERCNARTEAHIGNQTPMEVTCRREPGHTGQHQGPTLDSDDNWVRYDWSDDV